MASPHHPQSDGQTERAIQTFLRLIRTYASVQENQWEEMLPLFQFSINDSYCEAIRSTPFRVLFGCDPIAPNRLITRQLEDSSHPDNPRTPTQWEERTAQQLDEIWRFIRQHQEIVAQRMKTRFDRGLRPREFNVGEFVLLSTKSHQILAGNRKHAQRYAGPYFIKEKINENAFRLAGLPTGVPSVQNIKFLKLFKPTSSRFSSRPATLDIPETIDGGLHWEVAKILEEQTTRKGTKYLVLWAGGGSQKQWLPLRCLTHCEEVVRDYYDRNNLQIPLEVEEFYEERRRARNRSNHVDTSDPDQDSAPEISEDEEET